MSFIMSITPGIPSSLPSSAPSSPPLSSPPRPVRTIPGSYGWPVLGPISDRLDYFWFQGPETFFRKRSEIYKSSVYRTNVPPSFPFLNVNPNVVAVLDCKSFSYLFDMELVEKKDVLVGDFMPSVKFTGNLRTCAYLDTSEPQHAKIKNFAMNVVKQSSKVWGPELTGNLAVLFDSLEAEVSKNGEASYLTPLQKCVFKFLTKCLFGADTATSPKIDESGYAMLNRWLALQVLPTVHIGRFQPLEEILLHSFAYPAFLASGDYKNLYQFVRQNGKEVIKMGEIEFGLGEEEIIHNLLFLFGFNAFGGFSVFLPSLINLIASDKTGLQAKLVKEVRENVGTTLSFESVKKLPLVQSVVYEALRFNPPVPLQFGRARKDFQLSSHDSAFDIKKGELLCGYQALVMRDGKVFDEPETFKPDRFAKNKELLNYLYWSNGPQTGSPSESNKQCAGKDIVVLTAFLFVAYVFQRYDSITGTASSITALEKAK